MDAAARVRGARHVALDPGHQVLAEAAAVEARARELAPAHALPGRGVERVDAALRGGPRVRVAHVGRHLPVPAPGGRVELLVGVVRRVQEGV